MMKNGILIFALMALACNKPPVPMENRIDPVLEGFTKTQIISSTNANCSFLLQTDEGIIYEVENLESTIPNLKSGEILYIQFNPLRRMSVCEGQPIAISEWKR